MTNRYDEKERRIHCAFSEKCGGCDYAGMKYDNELAVKKKYIEELFGEYGYYDYIFTPYETGTSVKVVSHLTKTELDLSDADYW